MSDRVTFTPEAMPRLYALRRDPGEEDEFEVIAWGMKFPDGRAVTAWVGCPGTGVAHSGSVRSVEQLYAPASDAHVVWPTGTN